MVFVAILTFCLCLLVSRQCFMPSIFLLFVSTDSSTDVSNLWKNLRDGFVKEKQTRNKENVSGLKGNNRKPFPFYDQMQFVEPYVRHRRSLCTTDGDGEDGDASQNDLIENQEEEETLEIADALIEVVMVTDSEGTNLQPSEQAVTEAQSIPGNDAAKDHLFGAGIKRKNTEEPAPAAKKSVSLSSVPVLSPAKKRGVHLSRSTAKERDNINNGLKQALDQIQKSMTAVSDPDAALGESIVAALSAITDIDKKRSGGGF
ncbi:uncharacterized protein LOC117652973 [Thrips palmi]|uniref:Uncharacterized protein LOC117652973 n=1 Tax=Thrips palmi TaxID=161013 RepID=A0A6P9A9C3_THRPL|nr:uncharacterized protein LOC117652973 [Thrips palmi]